MRSFIAVMIILGTCAMAHAGTTISYTTRSDGVALLGILNGTYFNSYRYWSPEMETHVPGYGTKPSGKSYVLTGSTDAYGLAQLVDTSTLMAAIGAATNPIQGSISRMVTSDNVNRGFTLDKLFDAMKDMNGDGDVNQIDLNKLLDIDGDGVNNLDDPDADGDGDPNAFESKDIPVGTTLPAWLDSSKYTDRDKDGLPDFKDTDGDGWLNNQERKIGTDPLNESSVPGVDAKLFFKDSTNQQYPVMSGDMVTGFTEERRWHEYTGEPDWTKGVDTDKDGIPDAVEVLMSTDPNNASSFNDGDSDGRSDFIDTGNIEAGDTDFFVGPTAPASSGSGTSGSSGSGTSGSGSGGSGSGGSSGVITGPVPGGSSPAIPGGLDIMKSLAVPGGNADQGQTNGLGGASTSATNTALPEATKLPEVKPTQPNYTPPTSQADVKPSQAIGGIGSQGGGTIDGTGYTPGGFNGSGTGTGNNPLGDVGKQNSQGIPIEAMGNPYARGTYDQGTPGRPTEQQLADYYGRRLASMGIPTNVFAGATAINPTAQFPISIPGTQTQYVAIQVVPDSSTPIGTLLEAIRTLMRAAMLIAGTFKFFRGVSCVLLSW